MSSESGMNETAAEAVVAATPAQQPQSCRKKKSDVNEGFVKDMINHIDEFVHASYDEHKSCLAKTVRKLFGGMSKTGPTASTSTWTASTSTSAPTPVVSVLPLRVTTE